MKKPLFNFSAFIYFSYLIFLFSCNKNDRLSNPISNVDTSTATYKYIKALGFDDKEIVDLDSVYLVDGDILFAKNSKPDFSIFGGQPQTEQYGTANYVGYNIQSNVRIIAEAALTSYSAQIDGAITLWNNIPNCRLKFNRSALPQITIKAGYAYGACAVSYFPMNGNPGSTIIVDLSVISSLSTVQIQSLIAHELGHTIGFRHTNWQSTSPVEPQSGTSSYNGARFSAMHILGTPTGNDPTSIMNGQTCGISPTTLSNFDILAMQFMYPANPPVAGTVPVFRYYKLAANKDHFYTTNYNEAGNGINSGYVFQGIGFFAFPNQVTGTVPVYRYYKSGTIDHFYTPNYSELGGGSNGYVYEGIAFYAYQYGSTSDGARRNIYRYYNSSTGDHFYTKDPNEVSGTSYIQQNSPSQPGFFAY